MTRDTWSFRLGELGTEAEQLVTQLAATTGQRINLSDYIRDAIRHHNKWANRVLAATEIPAGDILITAAETIVAGRHLTPGTYRIAGTTDLIQIGDTAPDGEQP